MTGVVIFLIGNLLQITAMYSWAHLTVGRFVAVRSEPHFDAVITVLTLHPSIQGIGVGVISIGVPLYESEVCPKGTGERDPR